MLSRQQTCQFKVLAAEDDRIKKIQVFNNLGCIVTDDGKRHTEYQRRIETAKVSFEKLNKVLRQ